VAREVGTEGNSAAAEVPGSRRHLKDVTTNVNFMA